MGSARDVDYPVHVLRRIVETGIRGIDMRMTGFTGRARRKTGMGGNGRRKAMTCSATGCRKICFLAPDRRFVGTADKGRTMTVGVGALQSRLIKYGAYPAGLRQRAEHDGTGLSACGMVPGTQKMVESDRAESVVACGAVVGHVEAGVARMGKGDIGIDRAAGGRAMARGAVFQCSRKSALVAERAGRGAGYSPDTIQVRSMAAVAGIETGGAALAVEIPRGADGIDRGYGAECSGNLKDAGMGRQRCMAYFTPRVAEGCIDEISELDIEARVAARSSETVVGMALLLADPITARGPVLDFGGDRLEQIFHVRPGGR